MPNTIINNGVINLGRCCPKYRGDYASYETYRGLDYVLYRGKVWLAVHHEPFVRQEPQNGEYWREVAINISTDSNLTPEQIALLKGPAGPAGPQGPQGEPCRFYFGSSIADLKSDASSIPDGGMVLVITAGDQNNAKMYVKDKSDFMFLADIFWRKE